ncbi:hypothetical protein Barb6XT_01325 [Bacteroidales bacterium Barb6XT]|nr:hypothetical protein Barb6XT_01325 [Bacteroidales bacterium Barb6XT]
MPITFKVISGLTNRMDGKTKNNTCAALFFRLNIFYIQKEAFIFAADLIAH